MIGVLSISKIESVPRLVVYQIPCMYLILILYFSYVLFCWYIFFALRWCGCVYYVIFVKNENAIAANVTVFCFYYHTTYIIPYISYLFLIVMYNLSPNSLVFILNSFKFFHQNISYYSKKIILALVYFLMYE